MTSCEIRDPIYGFIPVNEWERTIIDHPIFQRLRRIKQLALTDLVYPGANHTRFEHSLGVMHFASLMYDAIVSKKENQKLLSERMSYAEAGLSTDRQLVRLAALLHDIGHAPFSHAAEDAMPINKSTNKKYKHEDYSKQIIEGPLKEIIENHDINKSNYHIKAEEVAALIEGNGTVLGPRIFWKVIISSQLDADRGDYLLRDSHHLGVKYGVYDYQRLLNTLSLGIDPESDDTVLGVSEAGIQTAEALVIARYLMFTQVYFHKTRRAFDYHLRRAIKTVLKGKSLPSPKNIKEFLELDEYDIIRKIKANNQNEECLSIINRNPLREAYSTSDTPSVDEVRFKNKILKRLEKEGIWKFEDPLSDHWYKFNTKTENKEIMIIKKFNHIKPLSEYSNVVKNMGEIKKIRIFVKLPDRGRAKKIVEEFSNKRKKAHGN